MKGFKPRPLMERIAQKIDIDPVRGCWLWRGTLHRSGYAQLSVGGKNGHGHRALWIELHGPLDRHEHVLHRCDVRHCCNPEHLFAGTHQDNMADRGAKSRQARGEQVPNAKLTASQVLAIRADPRLQRHIAAEYGLTQACVSLIKRRDRWAHLDQAKEA